MVNVGKYVGPMVSMEKDKLLFNLQLVFFHQILSTS